MANIMEMKSIRNKPSRNGFDLSFKRNFTAKTGELLPIMCKEVIPGDKFTIDLSSFTRTMPVNTAAYARVREYYDFYYVPFHLLWNRANEVLSQMDYNQMHATALDQIPAPFAGELPYVTTQQICNYISAVSTAAEVDIQQNFFSYKRANLSCKLLEYLNYGNFEGAVANSAAKPRSNVDMNVMYLAAYQKIYCDYFRDEQWEKPSPSTFNFDYMNGSQSMNVQIPAYSASNGFFADYNMFDMRYCNWQKDLYHGLLPSAQYGETSVVPLSSSGSSSITISNLDGYLASAPDVQPRAFAAQQYLGNPVGGRGSLNLLNAPQQGSNNLTQTSTADAFALNAYYQHVNEGSLSGDVNSGSIQGLSILALRQYEFLQKWKEIAQAGDQNFAAMTKRIWGVDVSPALSDKCRYLGGISSSLGINEVVNTNLTGDAAQAEIYGKGIGQSRGVINFNSDGQYGCIMCIYHSVPIVDYTVDYIDPQVLRVNAEDFANPVFDRVGMQSVSDISIMNYVSSDATGTTTPAIYGYAPRYIDYKTSIDTSVGAFKRDMSHWVVAYGRQDILQTISATGITTDGQPAPSVQADTLNYSFFKVNPNMLDPLFVTQVDSDVSSDQFLVSAFFDIKAVRNLDTDGLPY